MYYVYVKLCIHIHICIYIWYLYIYICIHMYMYICTIHIYRCICILNGAFSSGMFDCWRVSWLRNACSDDKRLNEHHCLECSRLLDLCPKIDGMFSYDGFPASDRGLYPFSGKLSWSFPLQLDAPYVDIWHVPIYHGWHGMSPTC